MLSRYSSPPEELQYTHAGSSTTLVLLFFVVTGANAVDVQDDISNQDKDR